MPLARPPALQWSPAPQPPAGGGELVVAEGPASAAADEELKAELRFLAHKQRMRLEQLRGDADARLRHYAELKQQELEMRKSRAQAALQELQPRLDRVRQQWGELRSQSAVHEDRYRKLAEQYQAAQTRLKVLHDAIDGAQVSTGEGRTGVAAMRAHLEEIGRDKQDLRAKIKRALDCLLVDENMLQSRLQEEKEYAQELRGMVAAVDEEVAGYADTGDAAVQELEHSVRVVDDRLVEMKQATSELYDRYLQSAQSLRAVQEDVLLAMGEATSDLATHQELREYKDHARAVMQGQVDWFLKQGYTPKPVAQCNPREYWFENKVEVLTEVLRETQALRERRQIRDQDHAGLAETTARCNQAKAQLHAVELKIEGKDKYRRKLIDEVVDMRALLDDKLQVEDSLVAQLDAVLAELGEDPAQVHELIERAGFDNYVSSESGEDALGDFVRLDEEGTHDVEAITTSLEFDPADPSGAEAVQRHAHRKQGPLRDFAERRAAQLSQRPPRRLGIVGSARRRPMTLETVLLDAQTVAATEVVSVVRMRQDRIASGLYDPRDDQVFPDPQQRTREERIRLQVEAYKEQQRGGGDAAAARPDAGGFDSGPTGDATDAGLVSGTQDENALAYLQRAVNGFHALMFFSGPVGPFQRQVFLTKDLKRLAWRRPAADIASGVATHEEESIVVADMRTIATGHRTEVFRQHRESGQAPMREAAALSVITAQQTSVDLEFDRQEERDYWAQILSTVANESRPGGAVHTVIASGRIIVHDTSTPDQRSNTGEPFERRHVTLSLA
eukprot:TRINITY_DN17851_c1_g1_i1.p1 TRINITY_DN17851_c1_g1~~TRINITY_DN17851_c1_g1_i1.p1  ORF type:complete len:817 (+),score=384.56 TRINITY_DN17851_c1_g1_i1:90-2453(+)